MDDLLRKDLRESIVDGMQNLSSWRESIVDLLDHLRLDGPDDLVDLLHALTSSTEITSLKASPRSCSQPNIRENLVSSSQYNAEAKGMANRAPAPAVAPRRNGSNTVYR
jgi:hypothetical protein